MSKKRWGGQRARPAETAFAQESGSVTGWCVAAER